jgi:ATP-dependent Lon protease
MLVAQKAAAKDEPKAEDMYDIGCVSNILQMLKLPDGTVKVLVEGLQRAIPVEVTIDEGEHFVAEVLPICPTRRRLRDRSAAPRRGSAVRPVRQAQQEDPARDPHLHRRHRRAGRLADTIAAHLPLKLEQKQAVLDLSDVGKRLEKLLNCSSTRSTSCRSRSASVAASSGRWRRASASTT